MGQRPSTVAMAQLDQLQAAAFCGIVSFSLRRGGGKQKQCVFHHGAFFGHIVGIIARGRLTLIGMLLLLVHDDKAEILQRCKDGAAGAYHNVGIALLDHAPLQKAFSVIERRVLHSQTAADLAGFCQRFAVGQADDRTGKKGVARAGSIHNVHLFDGGSSAVSG
jgi:hypothetical protein